MRRTANTILHGIGCLLLCLGFIMMIGAAGNSDLGAEMGQVVRYETSGFLTLLCGAFLKWWRI